MRDHSATLADVDPQPPRSPQVVGAEALSGTAASAGAVVPAGVGTRDLVAPARPDGGALSPLIPTGLPLAGPRRMGWRFVLAAFLAAVPLACIGGLFIGFHLYDNATRPDRGTPAKTVQSYLQALLVNRDDADAAQYACAGATELAGFVAHRGEVLRGAEQAGSTVTFSWGALAAPTMIGDDRASLDVQLTITATANPPSAPAGASGPPVGPPSARQLETWDFETDRAGEWCVSSATQLP
jgi:hypothetical protein